VPASKANQKVERVAKFDKDLYLVYQMANTVTINQINKYINHLRKRKTLGCVSVPIKHSFLNVQAESKRQVHVKARPPHLGQFQCLPHSDSGF
jgi:hypothetical protein